MVKKDEMEKNQVRQKNIIHPRMTTNRASPKKDNADIENAI